MTVVPIVDHVTLVTTDADALAARFRDEYGLASFQGGYLAHLGARSSAVPLRPPSYVEWLQVDDRAAAPANGRDSGKRVLAMADAGGGLLSWTVLVPDIEAAAARTGVEVYAGETRVVSGAIRKWYTVTGPPHLPILIAYDDPDGTRAARRQSAYDGVGHTSEPGGYRRIEVGGDAAELAEWLGPHDLPVAFVDGPPGIVAAHVETARGDVVVDARMARVSG